MTSEDLATFIERRRRFVEAIGDGLAIVPAASETVRNNDVSHPFRQQSDFYFLTGFEEPDAVAVFDPAHAKERFVLFVRPRDREMVVARIEAQWNLGEIAQRFNMRTVDGARMAVTRALRRLMDRLKA